MTDYNDGEWHDFRGTAKPEQIHDKSVIEYVWHDKNTGGAGAHSSVAGIDDNYDEPRWCNILRFRVTKPFREPRTFYVNEYEGRVGPNIHRSPADANCLQGGNRTGIIKLIEVIE